MTRSMVDALSELCSPFLKRGKSAFIAAIASGLFPQTEYRLNTAQMAQIEIRWGLITKTLYPSDLHPLITLSKLKTERKIG